MHFTLSFLTLTVFMSGSLAEMCYECTEVVQKDTSGQSNPFSCAGGKFDRNNLPRTVRTKDCQSYGCQTSIATVEAFGYTSYSRGCANQDFTEDKCFDADASIGPLNLGGLGNAVPKERRCLCHRDFCNGAGSLNARQAIMGIVAGVLTIVLMQH